MTKLYTYKTQNTISKYAVSLGKFTEQIRKCAVLLGKFAYGKDILMYCRRLEELRIAKGLSHKQWSIESGVSIDTIQRITHPEHPDKDSTKINTLEDLCRPLGVELWEIFYPGDKSVAALQAELADLKAERDALVAENENLKTGQENLKSTIFLLESRIEVLNIQLAHKEEIIAIHNYYNSLRTKE